MSITLKVSPETLKAKASEVEGEIRTLQSHFETIQDIVSRTTGYWVGSGGDKARKEFSSQKESTDLVIKRFREHPTDLLTMAGIYEETERELAEENKQLTTDVIA